MTSNTKFVASEKVVARELGDEFVLLNLESGTYFGMNEVGGRAWELLGRDGMNLAELCEAMGKNYEVDPEVLAKDLEELFASLVENGLVNQR